MESYNKLKRYFLKKENRFKLASLLVLLLTMPAAILLVQQTIRFFSGAAHTGASVYILPSTANVSGAQTFQVMVDPKGDPVGFATLQVTFDKSKVQLTADPVSSGILGTTVGLSSANSANTSGVVNVSLGLRADPPQTAPTQPFELITLNFQPVAGVGNNVQTVLGLANISIVDQITAQDMIVETSGSTLTLNPVSATSPASGNVNMAFANIPATIRVNDQFTFTVNINTNSFNVIGTDLVVNYDAAKIRIDAANVNLFNKVVNQTINNQTGVYAGSLLMDTGTAPLNGNGTILTFTATALSSGSANLNISPETVVAGTGDAGQNLSVVSSPQTVSILAATPVPTPTPTATPTPTPVPTPTLVPGTSTPTPTPITYRNEDINQDTFVNILDYVILFQYYGTVNPTNARADINRDGRVNVRDYALLHQAFE